MSSGVCAFVNLVDTLFSATRRVYPSDVRPRLKYNLTAHSVRHRTLSSWPLKGDVSFLYLPSLMVEVLTYHGLP